MLLRKCNFSVTIAEEVVHYYFMVCTESIMGARGSVVVKSLCYKLEGHGFDELIFKFT
jgi:hypothetical protein